MFFPSPRSNQTNLQQTPNLNPTTKSNLHQIQKNKKINPRNQTINISRNKPINTVSTQSPATHKPRNFLGKQTHKKPIKSNNSTFFPQKKKKKKTQNKRNKVLQLKNERKIGPHVKLQAEETRLEVAHPWKIKNRCVATSTNEPPT